MTSLTAPSSSAVAISLVICMIASGCNGPSTPLPKPSSAPDALPMEKPGMKKVMDDGSITFNDDVQSNAEPSDDELSLQFLDREGNPVKLSDFRGKKNVVLVVTRGFAGYFCPYCSAQTSRLIRNHEKFEERNAEVIIVYPGDAVKAHEFAEAVSKTVGIEDELPLSIVLDEDLVAVNQLMIKGDLAKPSTYIVDTEGNVRFAYVGRTRSDRPSLKAIIGKLDRINASK